MSYFPNKVIDPRVINELNNIHKLTSWSKIIDTLCFDLPHVDKAKVIKYLDKGDGILTCVKAISAERISTQYDQLAGRIYTWTLYQKCPPNITSYIRTVKDMFDRKYTEIYSINNARLNELLEKTVYLDYIYCDYFSVSTHVNKYSLRRSREDSFETRQQLLLRVAVQAFGFKSIDMLEDYYMRMAQNRILHASPTNFNSCLKSKYRQLSSCFGLNAEDDIRHIGWVKHAISAISVATGGVGLRISQVRSDKNNINFRGKAKGIIPLCFEINALIRYNCQGGFRSGVCNVQLDVNHNQLLKFIQLRHTAASSIAEFYERAHDIDNTLLLNYPFMLALKEYMGGKRDRKIALFCPMEVPDLFQCRGLTFWKKYHQYESDGSINKTYISIDEILKLCNQIDRDSGHPYFVNIDAADFKSNDHEYVPQPDGSIKENNVMQTNLCLEIYQHSNAEEIFSCNLSQISLKQYVINNKGSLVERFDFKLQGEDVRAMVRAHNQLIFHTVSPLETLDYIHEPKMPGDNSYVLEGKSPLDIRNANLKRRPLGMGWSGFDDACKLMRISPFSKNGLKFGQTAVACYYFNAVAESVIEAYRHGEYKTFRYSPASKGKLQFVLWKEEKEELQKMGILSEEDIKKYRPDKWDTPVDPLTWGQQNIIMPNGHIIEPRWDSLTEAVIRYGMANSELLAFMPSATTSQTLSNTQGTEPRLSNMYTRLTDYGSFTQLSPYLEQEMRELGLWNENFVELLAVNKGSLNIFHKAISNGKRGKGHDLFPDFKYNKDNMKKFKKIAMRHLTASEIPTEDRIKMEAVLGRYICQGSSFNWFTNDQSNEHLNTLLYQSMMYGLKTCKYYLRQKDPVDNSRSSISRKDIMDVFNECQNSRAKTARKESGIDRSTEASIDIFNGMKKLTQSLDKSSLCKDIPLTSSYSNSSAPKVLEDSEEKVCSLKIGGCDSCGGSANDTNTVLITLKSGLKELKELEPEL